MHTCKTKTQIGREIFQLAFGTQSLDVEVASKDSLFDFIPVITAEMKDLKNLADEMDGDVDNSPRYNELAVLLQTLESLQSILTGRYTYHFMTKPERIKRASK